MNTVRALITAVLLASNMAVTATPISACFVETPEPSQNEVLARKARAKQTELKARKLMGELKAEAKVTAGDSERSIREDLQQLESVVGSLRELQEREYCKLASSAASAYVAEVVRRIEECGTRNFPTDGGKRLYGSAEAEFIVGLGGVLFSERMLKSGGTVIDEHISRLLQSSAPFGAVPEAISSGKHSRFVFRFKFSFVRSENDAVVEPRERCRF